MLLPLLFAAGGGCAAVPLATAGTLVGVVGSGVGTGTDLYNLGKLDATHLTRFQDVVDAVESVGKDARLALKARSSREPGWLRITYVDDRGAKLVVTVERRTETMTRSRIDVGVFGSETTARLFLRRMRTHLPPAGDERDEPSGNGATGDDDEGRGRSS